MFSHWKYRATAASNHIICPAVNSIVHVRHGYDMSTRPSFRTRPVFFYTLHIILRSTRPFPISSPSSSITSLRLIYIYKFTTRNTISTLEITHNQGLFPYNRPRPPARRRVPYRAREGMVLCIYIYSLRPRKGRRKRRVAVTACILLCARTHTVVRT